MTSLFPASKPVSAVRRLSGQGNDVSFTADISSSSSNKTNRRRSSRRIVRQSSWIERVSDLPFTLQLKIESYWDELDFADLGYPVGLALNGASFLIKLGSGAAHLTALGRERISNWSWLRSSDSPVEQKLEQLKHVKAGGMALGTYLSIILILISVGNAGYIWTRRRTYQLRNKSELVHSPNAYWVETEERGEQSFMDRFKDLVFGFFNDPPERSRVQQLDVWTPERSELFLRIFVLYPPPVSLLWFLLDGTNWWFMLVAIGLTLVQSNLLVWKFSNLVKDKGFVQAEVMHEYNQSLVYPRVFKRTRNVGVMTNEAEMVERPSRRYGRASWMPTRDFDEPQQQQYHGGMRKSKTSGSIAMQTHWPQDEREAQEANDSFGQVLPAAAGRRQPRASRHSMGMR